MLFSVLALAAVTTARSVSGLYPRQTTPLPSTFKWTSTPAIVYPKNDTRKVASVKDPSVIFYDDAYHVFASISANEDYNLIYFNVTDWSEANQADFFYLDQSGIGTGYRAAPQVFWFEPQKLWYLVYQNGNAAYSTNPDIKDPAGWTAPKTFYEDTPALIAEGLITPEQGYWVDMWVICNDVDCFLFSSDDNGRLYRSVTKIEDFPNGISEPVIAKQDAKYDLFEASMIYETGNSSYLLIVECIGTGESPGGLRYFRSWTSNAIDGNWTELAATQDHPFLGAVNVDFPEGRWSDSISHGEIIRSEVDQRLRIPTSGLQFLYQGIDPAPNNGSYNSLPWRLALATQVEDEE